MKMLVQSVNLATRKQWATRKKQQRGFSLIEMLVVIGLLTMLAIIGTMLFLNTLTTSNKASIALNVKQQGENALSQMTAMIRRATRIEDCTPTTLVILNQDENTTTFFAENNKIASNSGVYLTGSDTFVSDGPTFSCIEDSAEIVFVNINFSLKRGDEQLDKPVDIVELPFSAGVGVRRY
jgi:prepilin-type N-terminal cleavage/methylation domain-containing protein